MIRAFLKSDVHGEGWRLAEKTSTVTLCLCELEKSRSARLMPAALGGEPDGTMNEEQQSNSTSSRRARLRESMETAHGILFCCRIAVP
jgi:hypothetical protein